ncbi:hypothetical protein BG011_009886 [Mortierella polycephala]|uniref:DNA replication checkpoint mediator MRC1 domain-containing protein n=1 Tax=Mortierella polycephala TaxID=41804 RepID=A0A9P6PM73_9FUNG|nr:hypothetical protein BG011_009886 [Mortierella polycephala]
MADGMDKGLMALMGIEDDISKDEGLAERMTSANDDEDHDMPSFFDAFSDSDEEDEKPLTHRKATSTSNTVRTGPKSSTHSAKTSSLFASSSSPSTISSGARLSSQQTPRASTSSLFSPELNPFGGKSSSGKIRVSKSPKKNSSKSSASSMFSPTLSPRKKKKTSSAMKPLSLSPSASLATPSTSQSSSSPSSSFPKDVRIASLSPPPQHQQASRRSASTAANGITSPVSSFVLKKRPILFSDSEDSDISPLEDNDVPMSLRNKISLHASLPMTDDSSQPRLFSDEEQEVEREALVQTRQDQDEDMFDEADEKALSTESNSKNKKERPPKALSKTALLQLQMDSARELRNTAFSVKQRVNKKTLSSIMEAAQLRLNQNNVATTPAEVPPPSTIPSTKMKLRTIALSDDSDDETEQDVARRQEEAHWKQEITRALLVAPISKEKRLEISRELRIQPTLSFEKRQEMERVLQMSPLSNKIQNLSLGGDIGGGGDRSLTSPQKSLRQGNSLLTSPSKRASLNSSFQQRRGTVPDIQQYNELMKRQLAKRNLERRKQLEEEAKRSGTWKSPEEYAAEQLENEDKRNKGLDPEENDEDADDEGGGDYEPDTKADALDDEEKQAMDLGSADEAEALSGESDGEEGVQKLEKDMEGVQDDEGDEENESGSDKDEEEEQDSDDDDEGRIMQVKRTTQRKKNIIGDEDDIKVVVVDRSQAYVETDSEDEDDEQSEHGSGSEGGYAFSDENADVSDMEQQMGDSDSDGAEGTQGFGAFFESSYDPSKSRKKDKLAALGVATNTTITNSLSPVVDSSDTNQSQSQSQSQNNGFDGALDFLSGKFPTATPQSPIVPSNSNLNSSTHPSNRADVSGMMDSQVYDDTMAPIIDNDAIAGMYAASNHSSLTPPVPSALPKNAFDVMRNATNNQGGGLQRLEKREAKPQISKTDKSAFIEYEAEEEEDEHMGMGGIDYESENDNDDYDLGDGMVDMSTVLDSQGAENVRKLHMKHEQDQHNKEISDLVQGIAAGGLWKRGKGQMDDLDLFDEEDMDGRFRRKKKLRLTEKIEKLADNPKTAAYARAFRKDKDDDLLVFLSDPEDHDDATKDREKISRALVNNDEDEDMTEVESKEDGAQPVVNLDDQVDDDDEEEEETLNTDKRMEKLRRARTNQDGDSGSMEGSLDAGTIVAVDRNQALPFGIVPAVEESTFDEFTTARKNSTKANTLSDKEKKPRKQAEETAMDPVDEFKEMLRRKKVIQDIIEGVEEPMDYDPMEFSPSSSQRRRTSSKFSTSNLMDRIVDRQSAIDETATGGAGGGGNGGSTGVEADVAAIARPRMLSRQSSSFLVDEERRAKFLSTVGEESRGSNANNRVVKEVNRRKMAFATSKRSSSSGGDSVAASATTASSIATSKRKITISNGSNNSNSRSRSATVDGRSNRLLKILSVEEE